MKRLLLLHREHSVKESLHYLLEGAGFSVRSVATSSQAFAMWQSERSDIFITSLSAQWLCDGSSLVSDFRKRHPDLTIITLSGDGEDQTELRAKELGASHHFYTPIAFASLLEVLQSDTQ